MRTLELVEQEIVIAERKIADLEEEVNNLQLERCCLRYGFKCGDTIVVNFREWVLEPSDYLPVARLIAKDGKTPTNFTRHCYSWEKWRAGTSSSPFRHQPIAT